MILKDGETGTVIAAIGCPEQGTASAVMPRTLLHAVSDIELPKHDPEAVRGLSVKTGEWVDLTQHGARRLQWV